VHVHGNWLPRTVLGRLHAVCAYLRCLLLALALLSAHMPYHVVILDQVSAPIPLIRLASRAKASAAAVPAQTMLFLLILRSCLRCRSSSTATFRTCCSPHALPGCVLPIGLRWTRWSRAARAGYAPPASAHKRTERTEHLLQAHAVVVNSNYTAGIFAATFTRLHALGVRPEVLYPAAALPPLAHLRAAPSAKDVAALARAGVVGIPPGARLLLSINRFERKKGLPLALRSLAELRSRGAAFSDVHLVIAGGYDARLAENVEHLRELRAEAQLLQLSAAVTFLPSFSDAQKAALLAAATLVLYTPQVRRNLPAYPPLLSRAAARALRHGAAGGDGSAAARGRLRERWAAGEHRGRGDGCPVPPHASRLCPRSRAAAPGPRRCVSLARIRGALSSPRSRSRGARRRRGAETS